MSFIFTVIMIGLFLWALPYIIGAVVVVFSVIYMIFSAIFEKKDKIT